MSNINKAIYLGGGFVMSKKKRFLSLLMGAISSLSIVGAKGKKSEVKGSYNNSVSVSTSQSKNTSRTRDNKNKVKSKAEISLGKVLAAKIKNEIFPNMDDLSSLKNKYDATIFANMFENENFKKIFIQLAKRRDADKASQMVIRKFNSIYKEQIISDLEEIVNDISYGSTNRWTLKGCCVSLKEAENRLGKKYYYDLSDLRDLSDKNAESVVLRTVLSHLMISDLRKLESKSNDEKSVSDVMKQMILSGYVSKSDSMNNISDNLFSKVTSMIGNYNKQKKENEKLSVSWLNKARESVSKDWFGDGYSWKNLSIANLKANRVYVFGHVFDKENKLNFVKK